VESELFIEEEIVEIAGLPTRALTMNGQIPAPTLRWQEGDTVRIRVHNGLEASASVHWHGLLVPNGQDGVPGVTNLPIEPGTSHVFEFPVRQAGTYWYHSHSGLQEQRGLYGAIVIEEEHASEEFDRDHVVVLSDWTHEKPEEILRLLKSGSETFAREKGSLQTVWGAYRAGGLGAMLRRSLRRMPPMDVSDVAYDAFLTNGAPVQSLGGRPGERIRLRVVNAAASSYFYLDYAGGPLQVIAADGKDVEATDLGRALIAVAETYDIIVEVPSHGAAEFRATAQDGSGHTSLWIGEGPKHFAPDVPPPDLYAPHSGHGGAADHAPAPSGSSGDDHAGAHQAPGSQPASAHGSQHASAHGSQHASAHGSQHASGHEVHDSMEDAARQETSSHHAHGQEGGSKAPARPMPPYRQLRSIGTTTLPDSAPRREIRLELTGDMERYVWSFDGKTLSEADTIPVKKGEVLRMVFENKRTALPSNTRWMSAPWAAPPSSFSPTKKATGFSIATSSIT